MAETKHTPGPWTVEIDLSVPQITIPEIDRLLHDPEWADQNDWERDIANARLIAAAPDLLAALREALAESGCDGDLCAHRWHETARAAIRRATEAE